MVRKYTPKPKIKGKCAECKTPIQGRPTKRFCSNKCTVANWRRRQGQ